MIDWITCRVPMHLLTEAARTAANQLGDRVLCYCPKTGDVRYESQKWTSVRSDSHQVTIRAGTDLWMQGSPGRVIADGDAVFSWGASAAHDLRGCVGSVKAHVEKVLGQALPPIEHFLVSRVDVTQNLALDSLAEVRSALEILRGCEGGRYRVSQQSGDTVYWSQRSKHRSGKAYAKGPHLAYLMRKKDYTGRRYSDLEVALANNLLRLELTLAREYFRENNWLTVGPEQLVGEWKAFFHRMIGNAEMTIDQSVFERVCAVAKTSGQGRAAYGCWLMIRNEGWERAREFYAPRTWYRHLSTLRDAGLGDADISRGQIVPLRRKVIEARHVTSWSQIAA